MINPDFGDSRHSHARGHTWGENLMCANGACSETWGGQEKLQTKCQFSSHYNSHQGEPVWTDEVRAAVDFYDAVQSARVRSGQALIEDVGKTFGLDYQTARTAHRKGMYFRRALKKWDDRVKWEEQSAVAV